MSSKIICGECGSKYWRNKRKQGIYWYCSEGTRSGKAREKTGTKCVSLNLKEDEINSLIEHMGQRLIDEEKKEEVLTNAINKIFVELSSRNSTESLDNILSQKDKLIQKKDALMDLLLDGTITKEDYTSKTDSIKEQISVLDEKETEIGKHKEENDKLFSRLDSVRTLFQDKEEKGIEVPLMCSHIEQIKVYQNRLDVYLDFLKNSEFLSVEYSKNRKDNFYDMPIQVGRKLSGGRQSHSGGRP